MRKLAFGAITFGLLAGLAACGGGGDPMLDDDPDAGDAPLACNPVEQTGCADGEKCTWINIDSATDLGTVGCVPDGTVPRDGACTYGADGETTGYDDCVGGQICISGACEPICTISPDSCDSSSSCSRYTGLFTNATPELGACDYLCDPVTQERLSNPVQPACGGTGTGINATKGCYGVFDGDFSCAGVPQTVATTPTMYDSEEETAYGPMAGSAYLNGCAPGFAPLLRKANDMAAPVVCFAFCEPAPTCAGTGTNCAATNFGGAPGSGHTCTDRGQTTQGCQYFWTWETYDAATNPPHPDDVGFCWTSANYIGDWDGMDGPLDDNAEFAKCDTVPEGGDANGYDPLFWGCVPFQQSAANGLPPKHAKMPFELATPADIAKRNWRY